MKESLNPQTAAEMKRKLTTGVHFQSVIAPLRFDEVWQK